MSSFDVQIKLSIEEIEALGLLGNKGCATKAQMFEKTCGVVLISLKKIKDIMKEILKHKELSLVPNYLYDNLTKLQKTLYDKNINFATGIIIRNCFDDNGALFDESFQGVLYTFENNIEDKWKNKFKEFSDLMNSFYDKSEHKIFEYRKRHEK